MTSSRTMKALTASLLGLTILASATAPAFAQDNGRDRQVNHRDEHRGPPHRPGPGPDFRHRPGPPPSPHFHRPPPPPVAYYRGRPRRHDDGALVSGITGLLAGTVIGALITSGSQSAPPPQVIYVQPSTPVPPQQASIMVPNGGMQNVVLNFSPTALPGQPYCRTYSTTVLIDGYPSPVSGVACQNPDGTWHLQS